MLKDQENHLQKQKFQISEASWSASPRRSLSPDLRLVGWYVRCFHLNYDVIIHINIMLLTPLIVNNPLSFDEQTENWNGIHRPKIFKKIIEWRYDKNLIQLILNLEEDLRGITMYWLMELPFNYLLSFFFRSSFSFFLVLTLALNFREFKVSSWDILDGEILMNKKTLFCINNNLQKELESLWGEMLTCSQDKVNFIFLNAALQEFTLNTKVSCWLFGYILKWKDWLSTSQG